MGLIRNLGKSVNEIEAQLKTASYLANEAYDYSKENKLLLKSFEIILKSLLRNIDIILKHEYIMKRVKISSDPNKNLLLFYRISRRCGLNERDLKLVKDIIALGKSHKSSAFEFSKGQKLIITGEKFEMFEINKAKLNRYLSVCEKLLENTNSQFLRKV